MMFAAIDEHELLEVVAALDECLRSELDNADLEERMTIIRPRSGSIQMWAA
jgi:hypothetical protein